MRSDVKRLALNILLAQASGLNGLYDRACGLGSGQCNRFTCRPYPYGQNDQVWLDDDAGLAGDPYALAGSGRLQAVRMLPESHRVLCWHASRQLPSGRRTSERKASARSCGFLIALFRDVSLATCPDAGIGGGRHQVRLL